MVRARGPASGVAEPPHAAPPRGVWALLVVVAGWTAVYRSDDTDVWLHLAAGRSILAHGLPRHETLCLAARGGPPWLSEWLYHVVTFALHALGGDLALALWRAAWTALAMLLAVAVVHRIGAASWNAVLLAPLLLAVARDRFQPRPELIFYALALLAVLLLERARRAPERSRTGLVWLLPAQTLWANLQGSWPFGPALAALYAAVEWLLGRGPSTRAVRARRWALLALLLVAASFLVPSPLETLGRPLRFAGDTGADPLTGSIEELRAWSPATDLGQPFTAWLALGAVAALLGGAAAWRASPALALTALAAYALAVLGVRFRGLAAWLGYAPLAMALAGAGGRLRRALAATAAGIAGALGVWWLATAPEFQPGVQPRWVTVPVRATAVAESLGVTGPVLNTFHHGGYILWARGEDRPPLIDGRGLGSREFRSRYARAYIDTVALDSLIAEWRFTHAILEPPQRPDDRLAATLSQRPAEWSLVFADDAGLLYLRRPAATTPGAYRLLTPDYEAMARNAAAALGDETRLAALTGELERARAESPWNSRATLWLALLALGRGDAAAALPLLESVRAQAPKTPGLALRLGMAREATGDRAGALADYRRALREPSDAEAARSAIEHLGAAGGR